MAKESKSKNSKPSQVKNKNQDESRVMSILKKEYAFENWILAILSPVLILYGVYIVLGKFGSVDLAAVLGNSGRGFIDFFFLTTLRRVLTGSFLIVIGALVFVYLLIPYVRPSLLELKKISWPSSKTLAKNTLRVFIFLIFLSLVFVLYSFALNPLFEWLYDL
jgi:preprotein translocase SecE subunit